MLLLNGGKEASFALSRGLRQGDPLSPYLFIIGKEILARLIDREVERGTIRGVKVSIEAPAIMKLFYVDDVMLFCNAKMAEVRALMNCLNSYCEWSVQCINIDKLGFWL